MKIAFIVTQFPALSETFILAQITGLLNRGHEVDIYALKMGNEPKVHSEVERYNLLERTYYLTVPARKSERLIKAIVLVSKNLFKKPITLLKSLNFLKYGKKAIALKPLFWATLSRNNGPHEIIHCHFGPNGNIGLLLKELGVLEGKLITTFHGFDATIYVYQHGPEVYKDLFRKGDLFTVNTEFTGNKVKKLGCNSHKIIKLPVSVQPSKLTFKERYLSPGSRVQILTVARLVEKKGIEYTIRAVAKVLELYPNINYQIAGDGPLRQSLQALIDQLGVSNQVRLLGWKNRVEIQKLFSEAHLFVLTSITASDGDQEGQGLVLQEAQASGLPVLSTIHNGIPEGVLDGQSGFLVPEKDVTALAEKLTHLIDHPEVWPEMGRMGREFVVANYEVDKLNDRLVEIYQQALNQDAYS